MKKAIFIYITSLVVLGLADKANAQCSGCTTTYATNNGANITVSSGQTICVNPGVTLSGQVSLAGGVICNRGTITNLKLHGGRGIVKNFKTIHDIETTINLAGNVSIYSYDGASMDLQPSSLGFVSGDSLHICTYAGGTVTIQNSLPLNSKSVSVYNGLTDPASPSVTNTAFFSVGSNLSINGARLYLYNSNKGKVGITGAMNLSNSGSKTVDNSGIMTIGGDVTIAGTGSSGNLIYVKNSNQMNVSGNFSVSVSTATFDLGNYDNTKPGLSVAHDMMLRTGTRNVISEGKITVTDNMAITSGTVSNSDTLRVDGTYSVISVFSNYHVHKPGDLVVMSTGLLINNGAIDVADDFVNTGRVKLEYKSLLKTKDFYNSGSDSIIGVDTAGLQLREYPRIWIRDHSENTGQVRKGVFVSDESLIANSTSHDTGFDDSDPVYVGGTVQFVSTANGSGKNYNPTKGQEYYLWAVATTYYLPCGAPNSVTLTANPGIPYFSHHVGNGLYYIDIPVYTWNPGGLTGQSVVVNPTSTTTYTVSFTNSMASYVYEITVVVAVVTTACGGPSVDFSMPDAVSLSGSMSGGTLPYTYQWEPDAWFINGTTKTSTNPQVRPMSSVCYTLTVTDAYGCHSACEVCLVAQPYAHLKTIPDGGYYKLFQNKLLFKYDGQYAATTLDCRIYNQSNTLITSGAFSSLVVNSGDNRYYYDANSLSVGYYTMEIVNEKKEKIYLKFKR